MAAILKRSENPADFDTCITFLKEMAVINRSFNELMMPHLEQASDATEEAGKHCFNIFALLKAKHELSKQADVLVQARNILFSQSLLDLIKIEYEKEPRITYFGVSEKQNTNETYKGNSLFERKVENINEYKITFSDGMVLTLKSLDDKETLEKGKQLFENKMHELAGGMRLGARRTG
jgi:hypothetical protein